MCGICGILSNNIVNSNIVRKMNKSLTHRGPDEEGEYFENGLGLAMRRLKIIDLFDGKQPIYNEDKSLVLFFNGEIYNYVELRKSLKTKGHQFKSTTDSEVIIHLFEEYGNDCVLKLRGMFAFAIWNKNTKQLFLARDRMGEKPLYIYQTDNQFVFSSELRSLMSSGLIKLEYDAKAIDLFFHYHYIPGVNTLIKNVRRLEAGSYLVIDQQTMKIFSHSYWSMEDAPKISGNPSKIIREKLEEVAKIIVRSDVPVGIALSGGIDSTSIAALAKKNYKGNLHAFTVGYEGRPVSDERNAAKKIATHLNLPFHEIEILDKDFIDAFPSMCGLTDDPIADISAFGYYSISKKAKEKGISVILQGQGGDEFFWGYSWLKKNYKYIELKQKYLENRASFFDYYQLKFRERYSKPSLKKFIKGILGFQEAFELYKKHKNEDNNIFPFYDYFPSFNWTTQTIDSFYGKYILDSKPLLKANEVFNIKKACLNKEITLTKLIASTYLAENGISQGDRLSMANSVELRLPLVDYQLIETVLGLRKNYSDINLKPKAWLIEAVKDILPPWIFELEKRGFEPPVRRWLNLVLQQYGKLLPDGILVKNGIISAEAAISLSKGHEDPKLIFPAFFSALVLEFWMKNMESIVLNK